MERLTELDEHGGVRVKAFNPANIKAKKWKIMIKGMYDLQKKLYDYEETEKTPEEIKDFENVAKDMAKQVVKLFNRLEEERNKHRWISVNDFLPNAGTWVLATMKCTCQLTGCKNDVLDKDNVRPKFTCVTLAMYEGKGWYYLNMERGECFYCCDSPKEEISPLVEVIAWMPLPESYKIEKR